MSRRDAAETCPAEMRLRVAVVATAVHAADPVVAAQYLNALEFEGKMKARKPPPPKPAGADDGILVACVKRVGMALGCVSGAVAKGANDVKRRTRSIATSAQRKASAPTTTRRHNNTPPRQRDATTMGLASPTQASVAVQFMSRSSRASHLGSPGHVPTLGRDLSELHPALNAESVDEAVAMKTVQDFLNPKSTPMEVIIERAYAGAKRGADPKRDTSGRSTRATRKTAAGRWTGRRTSSDESGSGSDRRTDYEPAGRKYQKARRDRAEIAPRCPAMVGKGWRCDRETRPTRVISARSRRHLGRTSASR